MSFLPYLQFSKVFHCGLILVESLEAGNGHNRVRRVATMKEFIRKYEDRIHGALSCFDRMLFRGYLPIMSGWRWLDSLTVCIRISAASSHSCSKTPNG